MKADAAGILGKINENRFLWNSKSCGKVELPIPGGDKKFFFFCICPDQLQGPHSHIYNGYRALFPRVKWLGCEAQHSSLHNCQG
jgi:hypothetical protein